MKFSEIVDLMNDYNSVLYSPEFMSVKFGCECGCGGDTYTKEQWDDELELNDQIIAKVKDFCTKYGIHYDGVESGKTQV